ncbi:MAG TPA: hypothetical protein VMK53_05280 [Gemmatimonadales bacterium]|nr:hypothetical protein [Gemmatimonadales bacterium]
MSLSRPSDTRPEVQASHKALLAALTPAERLARALALSALARDFAWAGARSRTGSHAPADVRQRFLLQVYGDDVARWVALRVAAEAGG